MPRQGKAAYHQRDKYAYSRALDAVSIAFFLRTLQSIVVDVIISSLKRCSKSVHYYDGDLSLLIRCTVVEYYFFVPPSMLHLLLCGLAIVASMPPPALFYSSQHACSASK